MGQARWLLLALLAAPLAGRAIQAPAAGPSELRKGAPIGPLLDLALKLTDPKDQKAALDAVKAHRFKSIKDPDREKALYVQAVLEDRLGRSKEAALTFHKLERTWPRSPYMVDGQILLAEKSLERKRPKDAEDRLRRALASDLPVETKRRAQELLLWTLVEGGRAGEGLGILRTLVPLGEHTKPSERGLVAMVQVLCAAKEREQVEGVRKDHQTFYPQGEYRARVEIAYARLLGALGDAPAAANTLQGLIQAFPRTPEADEARLALATLLSEGKLPPEAAANFPAPDKLLAEMGRAERRSEPARKSMLVKLRLAVGRQAWPEVVNLVADYRAQHGAQAEEPFIAEVRAKAVGALAQEALEKGSPAGFLRFLDPESVGCLNPTQRLELVRRFAHRGLPEPARAILELAPAGERATLRKAALESIPAEVYPQEATALFDPKAEPPLQALRRAQALAARQEWTPALKALARATPGSERIEVLLRCLRRPLAAGEAPGTRRREAEAALTRAPEKAAEREPLAVLVADLRAQAGDWKGALALYPAAPRPEQLGWVGLMRATCQARLGQKEAARATLRAAAGATEFKGERERLAKELGP